MLQVEWIDNDINVTNVLGKYEKYNEAFQSIVDWWNIHEFSPKYTRIIGTLEENNEVIIDYGSHVKFYRIRVVNNPITMKQFVDDYNYTLIPASDVDTCKLVSEDGSIRLYIMGNTDDYTVKIISKTLGIGINYDINMTYNDSDKYDFEPIKYYIDKL